MNECITIKHARGLLGAGAVVREGKEGVEPLGRPPECLRRLRLLSTITCSMYSSMKFIQPPSALTSGGDLARIWRGSCRSLLSYSSR